MSRPDDSPLSVILDRFDRAWAAGATPDIESFLSGTVDSSPVSRRELLIELVMIDLERRWRSGGGEIPTIATTDRTLPQKPTLEDYLARFPELGSIADLPTELIAQEYRVRNQWGDRPSHDEYFHRFPTQSATLTSVLSGIDHEAAMEATVDIAQGSGPSGSDGPRLLRPTHAAVVWASAGDRVTYFGDYELLAEIARGGMGVVFKARQVKLNRIVALKMILSGELAGEEEIQRFKTEAEAAANLDHPGIVPIYEIGEHNGQHYFSMGFVEGQSLADRVKDGPLPPREAAGIVKKVAEAVAYAHSKGVIHRDLKPANVLLDANGEPRVTDFGLAKQVQCDRDLTRSGTVMGTPSYMPPEQARGKTDEIGPRSDVYSLGAILYCLLTGRPPFQSANTMDVLLQVLEKEPVALQTLNPEIPKDLETVCLKSMQKEQSRRYETAHELIDELGRFARGEPILARPISRVERAWLWCKRNRLAAALGLAALALLVTGTLVSTFFGIVAQNSAGIAITRAEQLDEALHEKDGALAAESKARKTLSFELYVSNINAALRAWRSNDFASARKLLNACDTDHRCWEYRYLHSLFTRNHSPLTEHSSEINCVALSPDGKSICVAFHWSVVDAPHTRLPPTIWNADGDVSATLTGHSAPVKSLSFSPNGDLVATGGGDGLVRLWDASSGQNKGILRGHAGPVFSVAFSSDGKFVASGSTDSTVIIWDVPSGTKQSVLEGHSSIVTGVAFVPGGKTVVSSGFDGYLKVWDVAERKEVLSIRADDKFVSCVAVDASGSFLASGGESSTVKIWDLESGRELKSLMGHTGMVMSVEFSSRGANVITGSADGTIMSWDYASGERLFTLKGHTSGVTTVRTNSATGRIVSGGSDGRVLIWNPRLKEQSELRGHKDWIQCVAIAPNGTDVVTGGDTTLRLWDLQSGDTRLVLRGHTDVLQGVSFAPDSRTIASCSNDATVRIWDAASGRELACLRGHAEKVFDVDFSPDGKTIVSCGNDGLIKLWDAETRRETMTLEGHRHWVTDIAFCLDGSLIASSGTDSTIRMWDAASGRQMSAFRTNEPVGSLGFDSTGKRVVGGSQHAITIWEMDSGKVLKVLDGHSEGVSGVMFADDDKRVLSCGGSALKVWDTETTREVLSLVAPQARCLAVDFKTVRVAVGSRDRVLRIWSSQTSSLASQ